MSVYVAKCRIFICIYVYTIVKFDANFHTVVRMWEQRRDKTASSTQVIKLSVICDSPFYTIADRIRAVQQQQKKHQNLRWKSIDCLQSYWNFNKWNGWKSDGIFRWISLNVHMYVCVCVCKCIFVLTLNWIPTAESILTRFTGKMSKCI